MFSFSTDEGSFLFYLETKISTASKLFLNVIKGCKPLWLKTFFLNIHIQVHNLMDVESTVVLKVRFTAL